MVTFLEYTEGTTSLLLISILVASYAVTLLGQTIADLVISVGSWTIYKKILSYILFIASSTGFIIAVYKSLYIPRELFDAYQIENVRSLGYSRSYQLSVERSFSLLVSREKFYESLVWRVGQIFVPASFSILAFTLAYIQEPLMQILGISVGFMLYAIFLAFYYRFRMAIRIIRHVLSAIEEARHPELKILKVSTVLQLRFLNEQGKKKIQPLRLFPLVVVLSFCYLTALLYFTTTYLANFAG